MSTKIKPRKETISYTSKKGVKPVNEITETERIEEGSRYPFLSEFQHIRVKRSEKEKETISTVKRATGKSNYPSASGFSRLKPSAIVENRLTVHVNNNPSNNTVSIMLKPNEVNAYIKNNFEHANLVKVVYNGKIILNVKNGDN